MVTFVRIALIQNEGFNKFFEEGNIKMQAKYPSFLKTAVSFKTALKIKKIAKKQEISVSALIRSIIMKYIELNPHL